MRKNKLLVLATATILANTVLSSRLLAQTIEDVEVTVATKSEIANFETIQASDSKKAIIFVGGAGDSFHYWDKHINQLNCSDITVLGYVGQNKTINKPLNTDYLDDNAIMISHGVKHLISKGYKDIQLVAHSLGGVVSLKATHLIEQTQDLEDGIKISLVAVNSPIGGYSSATPAMYTPFARAISKSLNYAMATDMSPESDFYESISKNLSSNISTTLVESHQDEISKPLTESEIKRYEAVSSTFKNHILVGGGHTLSQEPKELFQYNVELFNTNTSNVWSKISDIRHQAKTTNVEAKLNKPG